MPRSRSRLLRRPTRSPLLASPAVLSHPEHGGAQPSTAIFIPVKNGMPLLQDVLDACVRQGADEFLIIDSGSTDGSVEAARAAGATVVEIPPEQYSHGLTRNQALEHTTADLLLLVTQDASPVDGWLQAYVDAFAEDERIAVVFGPHHPRPGTSPMIARELTDFFAPFSPDGRVHTQARIDEPGYNPEFLHNANAAYRRTALSEVKFRDIAYAEDQAFGRDVLAAGWLKAYAPGAGVLHAHDFPWLQFMRRYFDEYRGLYETVGLQMSFYPRGILRDAQRLAQADVAWLGALGVGEATRRRWLLRSFAHHAGRRVAAFLGGRAHELPDPVQRAFSLEGRAGATGNPQGVEVPAEPDAHARVDPAPFAVPLDVVREVQTQGVLPLDPSRTPGEGPLGIVVLLEAGGPDDPAIDPHLDLVSGLEARGHRVRIRLFDPEHHLPVHAQRALTVRLQERPLRVSAPVELGLGRWDGADVVVATTWRTVYAAQRLDRTGARAALLASPGTAGLDHRAPERAWAADALRADDVALLALGPDAGRELQAAVGREPLVVASWTDHARFAPVPGAERSTDVVVLYRPAGDPHGGGAAGLVLTELLTRRRDVRVVSCGPGAVGGLSFRHRSAGNGPIEDHGELLRTGTVGVLLGAAERPDVVLAFQAAGLPFVAVAADGGTPDGAAGDAATPNGSASGGASGFRVADPAVPVLADALERLLDDATVRASLADAGAADAAGATLDRAVEQLEAGVRRPAAGSGDRRA